MISIQERMEFCQWRYLMLPRSGMALQAAGGQARDLSYI